MRDRLRVRVRGLVGEPEVLAGELATAEGERRAALLAHRDPADGLPLPCSVRSSANARRRICALNAPARPRSPVSGTIATVSTVSRCSSSGRRTEEEARPTPAMSSFIVSAYGRSALIRSSARRSLAAATSSIARDLACCGPSRSGA